MKVVSYALFGSGDEYAQYLPALVLAHHNLFPAKDGWSLIVNVDEAALSPFLHNCVLESLVYLRLHRPAPLCKAMLWRMDDVFREGTDYVFCRDLDAPPMPRDRACMEAFITSKATMHTVHDNHHHVGIMGGLCGFRPAAFRAATVLKSLDDLYAYAGAAAPWAQKGVDQMVLNRLVYARPRLTLLEHRYAGWSGGKPKQLPPHERGIYGCASRSQSVPDEGWLGNTATSPSLVVLKAKELTAQADRLGFHLGCAGYDHVAARAFWEECGDPEIARRVRACEV